MGKTPFFSVLVPTYNQAQYLGQALDSLLAQADSDWEAVVVNDGSTDSTSQVLETYSRSDRRFRVLHKQNGGVASALNAGLREAIGEWICWLSSDDLFDRRKLIVHREWIARDPNCRFFFTNSRLLNDVTGSFKDTWLSIPRDPKLQVLEMLRLNYVHGNSICVHRDAWSQAGVFNEELRYAQDYDMWLRLLALYPATFIPERTCITREHALQETKTFPQATRFDSAKAAINFINQHNFAGLVPHVDLGDSRIARKALAKALDVAADPSGFVYMLGPHPALILRILEWAWSNGTSDAAMMQQIVQQWASEISCQYSGTAFGFFWKAVAVASRLPPRSFDYQPLSPANIAEANYWLLNSRGKKAEAQQIHRYLEKFESRSLPEEKPTGRYTFREIVIVCSERTYLTGVARDSTLQATIELARNLMRAGRMVLLTGLSSQGLGFIDSVMFVGTDDDKSWKHVVASLGPVDVLVGISRPAINRMTCARKCLDITTQLNKAGDPQLLLNGLMEGQPGTALLDIIDALPVRASRLQIILCMLSRKGQSKGMLRRMTRRWMIVKRRMAEPVKIVFHSLSGKPLAQWPRELKGLWIERQQQRQMK